MKHLLAGLLMACGSVGLALADMPSPTVSQTLQQLETDWANAIKDGDVDKVASYLADDWTGLAYDGKLITKKKLLADIKSGKDAATSVEMGPMEVKVLERWPWSRAATSRRARRMARTPAANGCGRMCLKCAMANGWPCARSPRC